MAYHPNSGTLLVVQVAPEFVEVQMKPPTLTPTNLLPSADEAADTKLILYGMPLNKTVGKALVTQVTPPLVEIKMKPLYG